MPPHAVLEAARTRAGLTFEELWIAYFALGGRAHPDALRAYLAGASAQVTDYDVLAQALNERFLDMGQNHPVPLLNELP